MILKLKNLDRTFNVSAPSEKTMSGAENKRFWVVSFKVLEHLTSDEVETFFTPENVSEMICTTPLPNGTVYSYSINGYTNKILGAIRHADDGSCVVDLQFAKEII